jgi:hypothetical protein
VEGGVLSERVSGTGSNPDSWNSESNAAGCSGCVAEIMGDAIIKSIIAATNTASIPFHETEPALGFAVWSIITLPHLYL